MNRLILSLVILLVTGCASQSVDVRTHPAGYIDQITRTDIAAQNGQMSVVIVQKDVDVFGRVIKMRKSQMLFSLRRAIPADNPFSSPGKQMAYYRRN